MTIDEANKKTLRPAMSVLCGIDVPQQTITSVAINSGSYDGVVGDTATMSLFKPLMDLAGDGFLNDGSCEPLQNNHKGIISGVSPMTLRLNMSGSSKIVAYGYENGKFKKWEFNSHASPYTITFGGNTRKIIADIVAGYSWWFDNSTLVSCSGVLRGVETKVENPELQMSEIEIKGYEPNDITDIIGSIATDYPIMYTTGYIGDMSPMRKFYLSDQIEWEDNVITFKGTDATRFLDDEYVGKFIGTTSEYSGGLNPYIDTMHEILVNSGINHEYNNEYASISQYDSNFDRVLIKRNSKRKIIAQAVNWLRMRTSQYEDMPTDTIYLNYVDAGIPKLWTGKSDEVTTIDGISKPSIIVEPLIKEIACTMLNSEVLSSASIETVNVMPNGSVIKETSDPYYSFGTSSGTIERLSPYSYKLRGTTSATVSGRMISESDRTDGSAFSPFIDTYNRAEGVRVTLEDMSNWLNYWYEISETGSAGYTLYRSSFTNMFNRSNILYEFEYRGDPRLQPRDYIKADVDGSETLTNMTIDSIEFSHEGGGYKQKITARRGLI